MRDREIDDILDRAARARHEVDPALLDRVAGSIGSSLGPVRPLPPPWVLTGGLVLAGAAVALAGAARAGFHGVQKMTLWESALIFPALAALIWLAATATVSAMIPGSRRRIVPGFLVGASSLVLVVVFGALFRDYRTSHFLSEGLICLATGLLHAIPAALISWLLLRRGFAVNPAAAGLAAGTLAGLAGVTMLELHCANFEALHVMLWHTAVVPLSGAAGALAGRVTRFRNGTGAAVRG